MELESKPSWRHVLTKTQAAVLVIGAAVLFQVFSALAMFSAEDLADWRRWLIGLAVGCLQAVGVAGVALWTSGGLSAPFEELPEVPE